MSKAIAIVVALLATGITSPPGWSLAADQAVPPGGAEFAGKYVAITYQLLQPDARVLFKDVTTRKLADQTFLVGEPAAFDNNEEEEDWRGVAIWIPIERIESIMIFSDLAKAKKVTKRAREAQAAREAIPDVGPFLPAAPPIPAPAPARPRHDVLR